MNCILTAILLVGIAANTLLAWELNSHVPPASSELVADLAAVRDTRNKLAQQEDHQGTNRIADQIYEQTEAMLEQRYKAFLRFIDLKFTVNGSPIAPASPAQLAAIDDELRIQLSEVASAKSEVERYPGGVIQALLRARLATIELTVAGLQQRRIALKHGLTLPSVPAEAAPINPEMIEAIDKDIQNKQRAINEGQAEANRYNGGLIQAVMLSRIEADKLTLAMLQQRRAALSYGINFPTMAIEFGKQDSPSKPPGKVVGDKEALQ